MSCILHLNLHREFFAQIAAGTKRIEYRSRTVYWRSRLEGRHYDVIQFRNGDATKAPEMQVEFLGVRKIIKWSNRYYAIHLGRILKIKRWKAGVRNLWLTSCNQPINQTGLNLEKGIMSRRKRKPSPERAGSRAGNQQDSKAATEEHGEGKNQKAEATDISEISHWHRNDSTATPVFQGSRLLVSGLMLDLSAESPAACCRWPENRAPSKRILSNTSNPVLQGEYIFGARSSGELVCLEAATGRQLWSTNSVTTPKNGASIHITPQGGGFFLFTDEGNLIRAQLTPAGYREISRSHLIDPTWPFAGAKFVYAPPAFANRQVFARSKTEVVCAPLAAKP